MGKRREELEKDLDAALSRYREEKSQRTAFQAQAESAAHRAKELQEKLRWWECQESRVRHLLNTYTHENGRLMNQIGRLRGMLGEVSRVSPGPPLTSETIRKIICLLEDAHIGDNP